MLYDLRLGIAYINALLYRYMGMYIVYSVEMCCTTGN